MRQNYSEIEVWCRKVLFHLQHPSQRDDLERCMANLYEALRVIYDPMPVQSPNDLDISITDELYLSDDLGG